jgi:Ca-activated chloride channel family protein
MFGRGIYENSRPGGVGLLQVAGEGQGGEGPRLFVPLKRSELHGEVAGPLAALRLVHVYGYTREQCDRVLEAVYRFPLPGDAAVMGVRVRFGEVEIVTQLKEREEAESEYREAVDQGKQATLLTRESPDVFTLQVAGIQPDQEVRVETSYVQLARPQGETPNWSLRLPLTTAPRYVREDEAGSRHAQGQPLALMRDPGHRFTLDLLVHDAGEISSPTHAIEVADVESGDNGQTVKRSVRLLGDASSRGEVIPDRDFVLFWSPRQEAERPTLSAILHRDAGWLYFLALVAPPATHQPGDGAAREVILLVDHSGSMTGPKWAASDWAVNHYLASLTAGDHFALGLFHSTTKWLARELRPAADKELERAARYLDENRDSGGTNLGVALEQALAIRRAGHGQQARHVLVVTDAQVTDAGRILRLADEEARRKQRRRISVLCIDAAPNAFLAHELAERGGGLARFLTSNPDEEDISTALEDVLADWAEPVLVGLRLEIDHGGGQAAGRDVLDDQHRTAIDLGDLPHGRAVWVAGRVPAGDGEGLTFQLATEGETVGTLHLDESGQSTQHPALKALFGARRILGLEYLIHSGLQGAELKDQFTRLGYDPDEVQIDEGSAVDAVYVENAREAVRQALKELLVSESLAYGLASAETAFVAVRSEAGQRIEGTVAVANALPAGWSDDFLSIPGGGAQLAMAAPTGVTGLPGLAMPRGAMRLSRIQPAALLASSRDSEQAEPKGVRRLGMRRMWSAPKVPDAKVSEVAGPRIVFSGVPSLMDGRTVLWEEKLVGGATLSGIEVVFAGQSPQADDIDRGLALWIYVEDMAMPRARIRLADLVRLGGKRPLNLRVKAGGVVRVVLVDAQGAWSEAAPRINVRMTM